MREKIAEWYRSVIDAVGRHGFMAATECLEVFERDAGMARADNAPFAVLNRRHAPIAIDSNLPAIVRQSFVERLQAGERFNLVRKKRLGVDVGE